LAPRDCRIDVDKYETKSTELDHQIKISLPGHDKDSVKISIESGKLLIKAESKSDQKEPLCKTESFRFALPKNCNLDEIDAKIQNGILTVIVAKIVEKQQAKKLEIVVS
jgi:HSP20 family protein